MKNKHELTTDDKLAYLFTSTGVAPIHADLRKPVKVESLTRRTDPNSMLAGLIRTECLDVDNTHSRTIGRIQLVQQPDLDCDNIKDDLFQQRKAIY